MDPIENSFSNLNQKMLKFINFLNHNCKSYFNAKHTYVSGNGKLWRVKIREGVLLWHLLALHCVLVSYLQCEAINTRKKKRNAGFLSEFRYSSAAVCSMEVLWFVQFAALGGKNI
jgi:hypothetical protein